MNPKIFIQTPAFNRLNIYTQIFFLIFLLFLPNLSFSQDLSPKTEKNPKNWLGIEFSRLPEIPIWWRACLKFSRDCLK